MNWIYFAAATAVLWGISEVLNKSMLKKQHAFAYLSVVYLLNFAYVLPLIFKLVLPDPVTLLAILIRSIFMVISMATFTKAMRHLPISTFAPMANLVPIFSLIMGFIILNETVTAFQLLGIGIIITGAYILDSDGKNWKKPLQDLISSKYMHFVIIYAFYRSLVSILSKPILMRIDAYNLLFYHMLFSMLMFLGITFFLYDGVKDIKNAFKMSGKWIYIATIFGLLGSFSSYLAFGDPNSKVILVVPILYTRTLFQVILGGRLFHEKDLLSKGIAGFLMILGVFLIIK